MYVIRILIFWVAALTLGLTAQATPTEKISLIRSDCSGRSNCYTSLADWAADRGGIPNGDLVAAKQIATARIEGPWNNPDTQPVYIDAWVTDDDHYIKIYTAPEARHQGRSGTGYLLRSDSEKAPFYSRSLHLRLDGLEVHANGSSSAVLYLRPVSNESGRGEIHLLNNLIHGNGVSTTQGIHFYGFGGRSYIYNNIIYAAGNGSGAAITTSGQAAYAFNNTIGSTISGYGIRGGAAVNIAVNNIINSQNACFLSPFVSSDFNICSGDKGSEGPNDRLGVIPTFVNASAADFRLSSSDTVARKKGGNLTAGNFIPFSSDIMGQTRCGYWDVGAFQVPDGTPCRQLPALQGFQIDNSVSRIVKADPEIAGSGRDFWVKLSWHPSPDAAAYYIYRNGLRWAVSPSPTAAFTDRSVVPLNRYNFEVSAVDAFGNESPRSQAAPVTLKVPDDHKPPQMIVIQVQVDNATNSALVTWTTDEPAQGLVAYGTSAAYGKSATGPALFSKNPAVKLSGLVNGRTYHYRVRSADRHGNSAWSADSTFTVKHSYRGHIFYVDAQLGSDSHPGTAAQPWQTIQHGVDQAQPGDTILVRPGAYGRTLISSIRVRQNSQNIYLPVGVPGYPLSIRGTNPVNHSHIKLDPLFNPAGPFPQRLPGNPQLNAVSQGFDFLVPHGSNTPLEYVLVENFEITSIPAGAQSGLRFRGQSTAPVQHISARGNLIHDINPTGYGYHAIRMDKYSRNLIIKDNIIARSQATNIVVQGEGSLVEGNEMSHNVSVNTETGEYIGGDSDGIRFFGTGHIIRYNFIHNILASEASGHIDCFQTFTNNGEIVRNILVESNYCRNTGQMFMSEDPHEVKGLGNHMHDIIFRNNVFEGAAAAAFHISSLNDHFYFINNVLATSKYTGIGLNSPYPTVVNNIFYLNGGGTSVNKSLGLRGAIMDFNLHQPDFSFPSRYPHLERFSQFGHDPQFVNPDGGDYRLQNNSPARAAGIHWPEIEADAVVDLGPLGDFWEIMGAKVIVGYSPRDPDSAPPKAAPPGPPQRLRLTH